MTPESSSLLLQRAAERLEQLESRAVIGPWGTCGPNVTGGGGEQWDVATASTSTTAQWVAAMSPSVASPLVAWLRESAVASEQYGNVPKALMQDSDVAPAYRFTYQSVQAALEFARLILGDPRKD